MSAFDIEEMLAGIRRWVEVETPTSAPERVSELSRMIEEEFKELGAITRRIPGRDGRGDHLEARSPWGGDGPGILILSHIDTVHPLGTIKDDLPCRIEGDRMYGPGVYDMKAGAYLGFAAFRSLVRENRTTPLPLRWLITADEEVGSPTSRPLIEKAGDNARHVLVTEPARNGNKCVTQRRGTARYHIAFRGRPAHSGAAHADGRSAIQEMAHQILALNALTDYEINLTTNVGLCRGGTALNVIPEHASLDLDVRLPSAEVANQVLPKVEGLRPVDPDVVITVSGGVQRPPYQRNEMIGRLFEHARKLAAEIGFELDETASGGGSDGNFLADRLPVLDGLGADGAGAHTLEEHILIPSLEPHAKLFRRLYETLT